MLECVAITTTVDSESTASAAPTPMSIFGGTMRVTSDASVVACAFIASTVACVPDFTLSDPSTDESDVRDGRLTLATGSSPLDTALGGGVTSPSNASIASRASWSRSPGSFARSFITTASSSGATESSGRNGGTGAVMCMPRSFTLLSSSNGRLPASIS